MRNKIEKIIGDKTALFIVTYLITINPLSVIPFNSKHLQLFKIVQLSVA